MEITASTGGNKSFCFNKTGNNAFRCLKQVEITISGRDFVQMKIRRSSSINICETNFMRRKHEQKQS